MKRRKRGPETAVLIDIELDRNPERRTPYRIVNPRLVNPKDAEHYQVEMAIIEPAEKPDVGV